LIDFVVWATDAGDNKTMRVRVEGKIREFPFYDKPNKYGLTFKSAISGTADIVRAKRVIYDGIWM
jgi:hypothetical protein